MRYVKMERKYKGNSLACYGCGSSIADGPINSIKFKADTRGPKGIFLCITCTRFVGMEMTAFARRKGYPVNIILEHEFKIARKGTEQKP